jgi:ABC-type oligopeptide transport system substrate-binding subunit
MLKKLIIFILFFGLLVAGNKYDGIWFMGFNLKRDIFHADSGRKLRIYLAQNIDRPVICKEVFFTEEPATGYVYPLLDYLPQDELSKLLAEKIEQGPIRPLILLHSDGLKTCRVAELIAGQLASKNIQVILRKVDNSKYDNWEDALKKNDYDLFLMGFKAEYPQEVDTFLRALYGSGGYANFMNYSNPVIDKQLAEWAKTTPTTRPTILKMLNKNISLDLPLLPIFYIEKME